MKMHIMNTKSPSCWIITEGLIGTENQCLGVAEALGVTPEIKRIQLKQPWKTLSPYLGFESASSFEPSLEGPWPDLLIAGGRKAIAAVRYIKKASGGKTFTVMMQDPRVSPGQFDLVAVPAHDPTRGDNVIVTTGAPNRITPARLEDAKAQFSQFETLKAPRVAVLIGGSSQAYTMDEDIMKGLAKQLSGLEAGLMITTSRRTGAENEKILQDALRGKDMFLWDGTGENPYFGMLAWADYILVTADSTSMLSDAATTGKPAYMIPLKGGAKRLDLLHKNLIESGAVRVFDGTLDDWGYDPLHDAQKVATEIKRRMGINA